MFLASYQDAGNSDTMKVREIIGIIEAAGLFMVRMK